MKKPRIAWKYALVALGSLAAVSLLAQYAGPGSRSAHTMARSPQQQAAALESLRAYLGLSDAQVMQLQDLTSQSRASMKRTSEQIRANQAALHAMLTSSVPADEAKTGRLVLESTNLRTQLDAAHQELVQKTTALLTPDQQQRLATLKTTAQTERQASPRTMPEAWPMIHAAAQLGLIAPPGRGRRLGMGFRPDAATAAPAQN